MNQDSIGVLSFIITIFNVVTYVILCAEYRSCNESIWMVLLKFWGGLFVFFISFFSICEILWYFLKI